MTDVRVFRTNAGSPLSPYSIGVAKRPKYDKQIVLYSRTQSFLYAAPSHYPNRLGDSGIHSDANPIRDVYRKLSSSIADESPSNNSDVGSIVMTVLLDVTPFVLYAICTILLLLTISSTSEGDYVAAFADFLAISILFPVAIVSSRVRKDVSRGVKRRHAAHARNAN